MKALGLVETHGLIASIEALDVMLKTAEVQLHSREFVRGGLVTVTVVGDVGAVKTAVDAADSAVRNLGEELLCSTHVIPRPDESIEGLFPQGPETIKSDEDDVEELMKETESQIDEVKSRSNQNDSDVTDEHDEVDSEEPSAEEANPAKDVSTNNPINNADSADVPKTEKTSEGSITEDELKNMKVVDLRNMAKKHSDFPIARKDIYRVNKEKLIKALFDYFNKD
ncbi:BMC domain-containing protein [Companilactobacillus insicii]|uniref:BMC domain-containing protein n=1 Tax=Companilactobacillus insicii TaxID=1732567 RepID=UPI000F78CEA4|nr:BMC domain-containing protein [Companilactobacillus insicii]